MACSAMLASPMTSIMAVPMFAVNPTMTKAVTLRITPVCSEKEIQAVEMQDKTPPMTMYGDLRRSPNVDKSCISLAKPMSGLICHGRLISAISCPSLAELNPMLSNAK